MKKWRSLILGSIFIVIGIVFLSHQLIMDKAISNMSNHAMIERPNTEIVESNTETTFDFEQVKNLNVKDVVKAQFEQKEISAIGAISVPKVNLHLPILYGVSNVNLTIGTGTMKKGQKMGKGNYALAGHNMNNGKALFSPLTRSKEGMLIYLTDFKKTYEYQIDKISIVQPKQTSVIEDTKDSILTLVTCNYDGTKRMIIQAKLIKASDYDDNVRNNIFAVNK